MKSAKLQTLTPRTDIDGAHQQGVFVATGAKLSKSSFDFKTVAAVPALLALLYLLYPTVISLVPSESTFGLSSTLNFITLVSLLVSVYLSMTIGKPYLQFAYNCFLKPFFKASSSGIDSDAHRSRLEDFYAGQADIYDVTRRRLVYSTLNNR